MIRLALSLGLAQVGFHAWIAALPVALAAAGRPDSEIGAIVGMAAVFNVIAALGTGGIIDRFGGRAAYLAGVVFLAAAAAPFALGIVSATSPTLQLMSLRLLQGIGLGLVLPSAFTLVPGRVRAERLPMAIGVVGVAANLSLALTPAISLVLLESYGLPAVGLAACLSLAAGAVIMWPVREVQPDRERAPFHLRPAWRPIWKLPLAASFLFVAHWGVVSAYLPQRATLAGADVGLFFMADALGLLALRVPAAWLAGRVGSRPVLLTGVGITAAALCLLLLPPTTPLLVLSGLLTGAGSAFFFPVVALELTVRSDGGDRGSAMALNAVAFGAGIALGSLGLAPLYPLVGFELSMLVGICLVAGSGVLAMRDGGLLPGSSRPGPSRPGSSVGPAAPEGPIVAASSATP